MGGLIWLASYPKSGNTWLRAFLAAVTSQMPEQEFDLSALKGFNIQASHYACYHPFTEKTPRELTLEDLAALRPRARRARRGQRPLRSVRRRLLGCAGAGRHGELCRPPYQPRLAGR